MNYLSVESLTKSYAEKLLFKNIGFGLAKGDKTALIAKNGSGKSTLLKIIAGKDFADEGTVTLRSGIRVGYLAQSPVFDSDTDIESFIKNSDNRIVRIIRQYHLAIQEQANKDTPDVRQKVQDLSNLMDKYGGWDFDRKMKEMLFRFGINRLDLPVKIMSGGQKKRLALAMLLLDNPELLLLDEPTNHLDIEMTEWLENYLAASHITLLMVTHDRYFLDRVCNNILELDNGNLYPYRGNYAFFLEKRAERIEKQSAEAEKAAKLMKKELEWMRRMPKARTHKSKSRIDAFYRIKEKAAQKNREEELNLNLNMHRLGGKILEVKNVSKKYGDLVITDNFEYIFKRGERIGIIGKNGVGKSTFLNLLAGSEHPDSGKIIRGDTLVTGYYTQQGLKASPDAKVIDVVKDIAEIIVLDKNRSLTASQFLNYFLFPPQMQIQPVSKLSGGEKRRLYLLTVLIKNPNFLILDEPANDLDIPTLNKLEEFLAGYKGCLILVSHDRYFLDRLTDHLFVFEGNGRIKDFYGNYTEYKLWKEESEKSKKPASSPKEKSNKVKKVRERKGLSWKEEQEYKALEKEIEDLEKEKSSLEKSINGGITGYEELNKLSLRIGEIIRLLDEKMMRWMELDEKR